MAEAVAAVDAAFAAAGRALAAAFPQVPFTPERDAGGVETYWFTSPKHHVVEWVAVHAVLLPFMWWISRGAWVVDVPSADAPVKSADVWAGRARDPAATGTAKPRVHNAWWLNAADAVLRVACYAHAAATIYYKASTGRSVYLFQPCHLSNYILCWLCFNKSPFASKVFYLYVALAAAPSQLRPRSCALAAAPSQLCAPTHTRVSSPTPSLPPPTPSAATSRFGTAPCWRW